MMTVIGTSLNTASMDATERSNRSGITQAVSVPSSRAGAGITPSLTVDLISAMGPPLDLAKIAAIRAAMAEGKYATDPVKLAAKMIETDIG